MIKHLEKKHIRDIPILLSSDVPIIIIKNFISPDVCQEAKEQCHKYTKTAKPFLGNIYTDTFYQIDLLPSRVQTERIFRSFHFAKENSSDAYNAVKVVFNQLEDFQRQYVVPDNKLSSNFKRFWQIIHYPRGGGFFDWHEHPRYPVNYGLILNLSKKNIDFDEGQTEFKVGESIIKIDNHADVGDLVLFRFDLLHRVAPCDPDQDLIFSSNGRWVAVLPIFEVK